MMGELAIGNPSDTVFALASGAGHGAISVIRLSGARSRAILGELCRNLPGPRRPVLRNLLNSQGELLDRCIVLWLPGPASYTGEDSAELHLHGGRAVLSAVSAALLAHGARPADPGEFTRRAFLAGKMDLLEAEAIADLVASETASQRIAALRQLQGGQSALLASWHDRLHRALAYQEALIDFPDENLPAQVEEDLLADLRRLAEELEAHIQHAASAQRLREGLVFAIMGAPNVGKSSLMNALARRDIAIVSALPGTTRDALETRIDLGGIPVTLIDTAGLRETTDPIEAEGVRRARARAASADLVLHLVDARDPDGEAIAGELRIANKIDLAVAPAGLPGISVRSGQGMDQLETLLAARAASLAYAGAEPVLTRARHAAALRQAATALHAGLQNLAPELRAEELRQVSRAFGRITGAVDAEGVLDLVFGAFCIGK